MSRPTSRDMEKMTRRNFVQTLSGIGLSGTTIAHLDKDRLSEITDEPSDEIPIVAYLKHTNHEAVRRFEQPPQRTPIYRRIPRHRWVRIETAHDLARRLQERLTRLTGSSLLTTGVATITSGQHRKKAVKVQYGRLTGEACEGTVSPPISVDELRDHVPDAADGSVGEGQHQETIEDIPIVIEEDELELTTYYDHHYSDAPAGVQIENLYGHKCTTCTPAYSSSLGEYVAVTAAHCFPDADSSGQKVGQPDYLDDFGASQQILYESDGDDRKVCSQDNAYRDFDAATIDEDRGLLYAIAEDRDESWDWAIGGTVTWDQIKNLEDWGGSLKKQGRSTGRTSGDVSCTFSNRTFEVDAAAEPGDSGGPFFATDSDMGYAYIAGVNSYRYDGVCGGTSIEKVEGEFGISV